MEKVDIGDQGKLDASLQLDAIFRAFPDLLFYIDRKGQILGYRIGEKSTFQLPPEQVLAHSLQEILPPEAGPKFERALQETIKSGKIVTLEYGEPVSGRGGWFEAHLVPLENEAGVVVIVRDVTEQVRSTQRIQSQIQRLFAIQAINTSITATFDFKVSLPVILRQMTNEFDVDAADILVLNPVTSMLEFVAGQGFQMRPQPLPLMMGQGYAGKAALERRTINISDLESQPSGSFISPNLIREKFASYYAVPLIAKGQVKGVLEIYRCSFLQPDDDWLDFLSTIAGQTAVAIDNANMFQELQRANADLSLAYDSVIESWMKVLELGNRESQAHASHVVDLTIKLASTMGIAEEELVHYRRGALLHDIGELGISESILNKPGTLDEAEWKIIKTHPQVAFRMLSSNHYLAPALDIPHYHHERWDGSGYPDGLSEAQIPFAARLFAVVDVYDALTSPRPYRPAWSHTSALKYIQQNSEKLFDPAIASAFSQMMRDSA